MPWFYGLVVRILHMPALDGGVDVTERRIVAGLDGLAKQMHWLADNVPGPGGRLMTVAELSSWCERLTGVVVSEPYLKSLRQGRQTNPSALKLGAIAQVYSVPTDFFLRPEVERHVKELVSELTRARRAEASALLSTSDPSDDRRLRAIIGSPSAPPSSTQ